MRLIKLFGLAVLVILALVIGYGILAISPKSEAAVTVKEGAAVSVDYSKFTIRELKAMARGTGIKSWEKLRKADLVLALSLI